MKDLPTHLKPRERLLELGAQNLENHELMSILLGTGIKGKDVTKLAKEILSKYENAISHSPKTTNIDLKKELGSIRGLGVAKTTTILACLELGKRLVGISEETVSLDSIDGVLSALKEYRTKNREYFVALYTNSRHQMVRKKVISIGTLDTALAHPREVYSPAFDSDSRCSGLIIAHNHPSGETTPSEADIALTKRLSKSGDILGIKLIDHIILTRKSHYSFKEQGYI